MRMGIWHLLSDGYTKPRWIFKNSMFPPHNYFGFNDKI